MRAGLVVASGHPGEIDPVAPLAGTPIVRRVADRLEDSVDALVVACRDEARDSVGVALARYGLTYFLAPDPDPERAPLSGLYAGLSTVDRETGADYAFVAGADRPFLDSGFVQHLFECAGGHEAAVPRLGAGPDPFHAVYRVGPALNACERAFHRDEKLDTVLSRLDRIAVEAADLHDGWVESLERVDSPAALTAAERRLGRE